jgi:hypothetical protein
MASADEFKRRLAERRAAAERALEARRAGRDLPTPAADRKRVVSTRGERRKT